MLAPETRALLTDALRPPDGWRVDTAVTTTYSLDLTALLLAPMSFALHETPSTDLGAVDGVALLEALRRYADRTTVFCQAGGIHLPPSFSPLLQFLEDSVVQVAAPTPGKAFHPKLWLIRFTDPDGAYSHRVLVSSRNLTFDRCWDTLLRLDELPAGATARAVPDPAPLADFVAALPGLSPHGLDDRRRAQVEAVVRTVGGARFGLPADVTSLRFLPVGLSEANGWPFPASADRALFISPFLDRTAMRRACAIAPVSVVLSRPDALDQVGTAGFDDHHVPWTFQRGAEIEAGEDGGAPDSALWEGSRVRDGLHAKTSVVESGPTATIVTGSANLTSAGFGGNVEFDVVMTGPKARCGIDVVWQGSPDAPGLSRLCVPYEPAEVPDDALAVAAAEQQIGAFHAALALADPVATVSLPPGDDDTANVDLQLGAVTLVGDTFVWPASLAATHGKPLDLDAGMRWYGIARSNVTPFFVLETTVDVAGRSVRATAVIKAALAGDVGNRRQLAMRDILRTQADVLRYLSLLLADPSLDIAAMAAGPGFDGTMPDKWTGPTDVVLLEPLVRASARGDEALLRVASILEELREMPTGDELVPDGLNEIWAAVWSAREPRP